MSTDDDDDDAVSSATAKSLVVESSMLAVLRLCKEYESFGNLIWRIGCLDWNVKWVFEKMRFCWDSIRDDDDDNEVIAVDLSRLAAGQTSEKEQEQWCFIALSSEVKVTRALAVSHPRVIV